MAKVDTKVQILDAAETLFAERGYAGTSIRAITEAARVNLAAANYHFGSKEHLLCEVIRRRTTPINAARLRRLDALEAVGGGNPLQVEAIVDAYIAPVFGSGPDPATGTAFVRLMGRLYSEPLDCLSVLYAEEFDEVITRFAGALATALPELDRADLDWRLEFILGMLTHTLLSADRIRFCAAALAGDFATPGMLSARMVAFAAAGMRAPTCTQDRAEAVPTGRHNTGDSTR